MLCVVLLNHLFGCKTTWSITYLQGQLNHPSLQCIQNVTQVSVFSIVFIYLYSIDFTYLFIYLFIVWSIFHRAYIFICPSPSVPLLEGGLALSCFCESVSLKNQFACQFFLLIKNCFFLGPGVLLNLL